MKSLLDIQQDLRNLEKSVSEITLEIKSLGVSIREMREANQSTELDYSKIELLSRNITFSKHPIAKFDDRRVCQVYLEMLLNVVRLDLEGELTLNRLVFLQWIKKESGIDRTLEELYKDCFSIKAESIHELVDIVPRKCRDYFMVDLLIVANIGGTANREIYEYIAGIATVFEIDKNEITVLSQIAEAALCQKLNEMKKKEMDEFQSVAHSFGHYISSDLLEAGIRSMRQIVVELADSDVQSFKWKVKQHQEVQEGDLIATYERPTRKRGYFLPTNYVEKEIRTPIEGTIYQFRDSCINYGVIAHKDDNKDSIKAWVKGSR